MRYETQKEGRTDDMMCWLTEHPPRMTLSPFPISGSKYPLFQYLLFKISGWLFGSEYPPLSISVFISDALTSLLFQNIRERRFFRISVRLAFLKYPSAEYPHPGKITAYFPLYLLHLILGTDWSLVMRVFLISNHF